MTQFYIYVYFGTGTGSNWHKMNTNCTRIARLCFLVKCWYTYNTRSRISMWGFQQPDFTDLPFLPLQVWQTEIWVSRGPFIAPVPLLLTYPTSCFNNAIYAAASGLCLSVLQIPGYQFLSQSLLLSPKGFDGLLTSEPSQQSILCMKT